MHEIDPVFVRKVWKRLRESPAPIVSIAAYKDLIDITKSINVLLSTRQYMPSVIHGYLGIPKNAGVTRFLPILTAEDMAVYYHLCYFFAPVILENKKGIYGAWHMKPEMPQETEEEAEGYAQDYASNPFSSHWWLKEWREYVDLIRELVGDPATGKFVVQTDIANFYDSIEIPRLVSAIRKKSPKYSDEADALSAFLSLWNRRHMGYAPSTKGIPQEIISDASRVLSHFYLQEFDQAMLDYCKMHNLTFIRWSDDFLIFGSSRQKLEDSIHFASRKLLTLGLNLSAAKTRITSKSKLADERCLGFLEAIKVKNNKAIGKGLLLMREKINKGESFRLDTSYKALLGYLAANPTARTSSSLAFINDIADSNSNLVYTLNQRQMLNLIQLSDDPLKRMQKIVYSICSACYGGPRATFLLMLRKQRSSLAHIGMTKIMAQKLIGLIDNASGDNSVVQAWCVKAARDAYL